MSYQPLLLGRGTAVTRTYSATDYLEGETADIRIDQPVKFTVVGNNLLFGGIVANTVYYVKEIIDANNFTISTTVGGPRYQLLDAQGFMLVRPIQKELINESLYKVDTMLEDLYANGVGGGSGITNVESDPSPTLGGNLNLNGNNIAGTGNIDIIGSIEADSFSGDFSGRLNGNLDLNTHSIIGYGEINISGAITVGSVGGNLIPAVDVNYDLGSPTYKWRDLYLSGSTIVLGTATISDTGSGTVALPAGSTVGGVSLGTINLLGTVATSASLPAGSLGDAYIVTTPSPAHLWAFNGTSWSDLGEFQGPQGDPGPTGATGPQGNPGVQGPQGDPGADGADGADGDSAYQVAVNNGFNGTEQQWLESLVGPQGPQGDPGEPGPAGATGAKGDKGDTGDQGPAGANGAAGQGVPTGGTAGQLLAKIDGTNYNTEWVDPPQGGGGVGLGSRTSLILGTGSIGNGITANLSVSGFKGYALYSIQTSVAAWVRVYTSSANRTADAGRTIDTDPLMTAGVVAEVVTTGAQTIRFAPAVIGYTEDGSSTIQLAVTNRSGVGANINVIITLLQLEA